jgi:hypothetical protein
MVNGGSTLYLDVIMDFLDLYEIYNTPQMSDRSYTHSGSKYGYHQPYTNMQDQTTASSAPSEKDNK